MRRDIALAIIVAGLAWSTAARAEADSYTLARAHVRCAALSTGTAAHAAHARAGIEAMRNAHRDGAGRGAVQGIASHHGMSHVEVVAYIYGLDTQVAAANVFKRLDKARAFDVDGRAAALKRMWYDDANCGLLIAGGRP